MSDHLGALEDAVRSVVSAADRPPAHGDVALDKRLWAELDQLGFTTLTLPESQGGSGGDLCDAAAVVRAAAVTAVPIAEATFLAGPVLTAAGLTWPGAAVTAAPGTGLAVTESGGTVTLHGRVARIPWLRHADYVVLPIPRQGRTAVAVVPTSAAGLRVEQGRNLAGEPRDDALFDAVRPADYAEVSDPDLCDRVFTLGAVARSVQMAGAAAQSLRLTVRHVGDRVQFGRPLAKFQAVQHQVARLASDVTTLLVACDAAVLALRDDSAAAPVLTAAAKIEASSLARAIAATSHQLHGAIGFTREHRLGTCTGRLWAWREEYGNELIWQERLASLVEDTDGDVWALLTSAPMAQRVAATA
jgi:acyl-CoA dehydrogenase